MALAVTFYLASRQAAERRALRVMCAARLAAHPRLSLCLGWDLIPPRFFCQDAIVFFFFLKKSTQDNQQAMTFSVLSAYIRCANLLWQGKHSKENRGVQKTKGKDDFWKKIWSIDCPPKIKHFLWRLSHNTLAVTRVLKKRGMKLDTRCCLCGRLDENGGHHLLLK